MASFPVSTASPEAFLNPNLDIPALREAFEKQGYVQVPQWIRPDAVLALYNGIRQNTHWNARIFDQAGGRIVPAQALEALGLTAEQFARTQTESLTEKAMQDFAYLFFVQDLNLLPEPLPTFGQWLHGGFLSFIAAISGRGVRDTDENLVTNYTPGCFLRGHSDGVGERILTFVASFTPDWQPDFGGTLQMVFHHDGHIETFVPKQNALMLFDVTGQYHYVTQVATYAPRNRYAVTGWLLKSDADTSPGGR